MDIEYNDYSQYRNYIQIVGENTDENGNITTYKCRNWYGEIADICVEDVIKQIKVKVIQNASIENNKIVYNPNDINTRYEKYKNYLRKYRLINKEPPFKFNISATDDWISVEKFLEDGNQIKIPSFCTGFGYTFSKGKAFKGTHYTRIIIDNGPEDAIDFRQCFVGIEQQEIEIVIRNPQNIVSMEEMFEGCKNLKRVRFTQDKPFRPVNIRRAFYNCVMLEEISGNIDMSRVVDASCAFYGCEKIQKILRTLKPDFRSVKDATQMFYYTIFEEPFRAADLNFRDLEGAALMFSRVLFNCGIDLRGFDLSKCKLAKTMFDYATGLKDVEIQETGMNIKAVNLEYMFSNQDIETLVIGENMLNTSSTVMYMASQCIKLRTVVIKEQHINSICAEHLNGMLQDCTQLETVEMGNVHIEHSGIDISQMFMFDGALRYINIGNIKLDNTQKLKDTFKGCINLETLIWNINRTDAGDGRVRENMGHINDSENIKRIENRYKPENNEQSLKYKTPLGKLMGRITRRKA